MQQLKIWVDKEAVAAFKAACKVAGVSMSGEVSRFIAEQIDKKQANRQTGPILSTRRDRRKETNAVIQRLEDIRDAEDAYKWNIPENLQGGTAYDSAEQAVDLIEQAIDLLSEAF